MKDGGIQSRAHWLRDGVLTSGSAEEYFPFFNGKRHVISLVGGGGKSTLLAYLAQRFAAQGMKTVAMTTTKMLIPEYVADSLEDCRACWNRREYAICGERGEGGKLLIPRQALLDELLVQADVLIVEADGARRFACKAPAEHEPVILPQSDIVIGVMGLEVMGGEVGAVCHRPQYVCALLGCDEDHRLTAGDMADILVSEKGTRKSVGERDFYVMLNKCDDEKRLAAGLEIMEALKARGHERVVLNRFRR